MSELKVQIDGVAGGVRIFRLTGPLVLGTMFEFQAMARADADSAMVIDLSGVPYMDSAGLGVVLGILASCQRKGRGFGVTGVPDRIRTLFSVTHVDGLIPTFDSVETAERQFSKSASA